MEWMMGAREGLIYLKSLFKDDALQLMPKNCETRIETILKTKLEALKIELTLSNGDLDGYVENAIKWSGLLSCNSCLLGKFQESELNLHDYKQKESSLFNNLKKRMTLCCIHFLSILDKELDCDVDKFRETVPANLLGANDRKVILSALQMIIGLGFYMNLEKGVGLPIAERSSYGALMEEEKGIEDADRRFLFVCVKAFCHLMNNKEFGQLIVTKFLGDVFGCLIQLSLSRRQPQEEARKPDKAQLPHSQSGITVDNCEKSDICYHQKKWCRDELKRLLDSIYQPLVIRELLMLQGFGQCRKQDDPAPKAPKWLQKRCSMLLTNKLMQPGGLQNILKAIFEEYDMEGSETATRLEMIGYLVSNCPFQAKSMSDYYTFMSKQILELIKLNGIDKKTKCLYMKAASSCISCMLKKDTRLTRSLIIRPLFMKCYEIRNTVPGDLTNHEDEMNQSIENIHKIFISNHSPQMVAAVSANYEVLFDIYLLLQCGISYTKSLIHELLIYVLNNLPDEKSLEVLAKLLLAEYNGKADVSSQDKNIRHLEKETREAENVSFSNDLKNLLKQENFSTEERIDGILNLLVSMKESKIVGKFFLMLLRNLAKFSEENDRACADDQPLSYIDKMILHLKESIPTVAMVAAICDKFGDAVLNDRKEIMAFIRVTMECCLNFDFKGESFNLEVEMLSISLAVLSLMLNIKDSCVDYDELSKFVAVLEKIERSVKVESVARSANNIRIAICTRGAVKEQSQKDSDLHDMDDKVYDTAIMDLVDPLIPTRAHAIVQLSSLLEKKNPKATGNVNTLIDIFLENLCHDDSYIYLASIRALASVSFHYHEAVIPRLAQEFANFPTLSKEGNRKYGKIISPEKRMKIGEALVKSIRTCGPILPSYSQIILSSLLAGVKDDDSYVRASSLSNIGEACKLLRFAVGSIINELVNCISSVLRFDREANVKRAALSVIILLLDGLKGDAFQAIGSSLKDIYQTLKVILHSHVDDVTKQFAENALGKLDLVTKDFLFPKQSLEKKISILQPP